jgi:hypothetical protein
MLPVGNDKNPVKVPHVPKWLWKFLRDAVAPRLASLFEKHRFVVVLVAILLAITGITGYLYLDRSERYQRIVRTTMEEDLENTPQTFKALESFILAGLDPKIQNNVENATLNPTFLKHLDEVDCLIQTGRHCNEKLNDPRDDTPAADLLISLPDDNRSDFPAEEDSIITDS